MLNAEGTAERRPACNPSQYMYLRTTGKTHECPWRVRIPVISLVEVIGVFRG